MFGKYVASSLDAAEHGVVDQLDEWSCSLACREDRGSSGAAACQVEAGPGTPRATRVAEGGEVRVFCLVVGLQLTAASSLQSVPPILLVERDSDLPAPLQRGLEGETGLAAEHLLQHDVADRRIGAVHLAAHDTCLADVALAKGTVHALDLLGLFVRELPDVVGVSEVDLEVVDVVVVDLAVVVVRLLAGVLDDRES